MAGWYCADCGGRILVGTCGELGVKLVCLRCEAEMAVNRNDLAEEDRAYDWDWEEEGSSVQAAFPHDLQAAQEAAMCGRPVLPRLSGRMPWG
jgi:hypothetical protein